MFHLKFTKNKVYEISESYICKMILRILILILLVGVVYRIYVRFIAPVLEMTKMAHDRIDAMKKKMDTMQQTTQHTKKKPSLDGEYVEFEEVK